MQLSPGTHQAIRFGSLLALAVGLPLSHFLVSVGTIALTINWFWEGNQVIKWKRFFTNPTAWAIVSIYLLHLVGLLWTTDWVYGWKDIRIKVPLLALPIILATSDPLSVRQIRGILLAFIGALFIGSLVSMGAYLGWFGKAHADTRDISLFISHIRFSLMIAWGILFLVYEMINPKLSAGNRMGFLILAAWLMAFLLILESLSGVIAFGCAVLVSLLYFALHLQNRAIKSVMLVVLVSVPILAGFYLQSFYARYFTPRELLENFDEFSPRGEPYINTTHDPQLENGYYVNIYIAPIELGEAWDERSDLPFAGTTRKGEPMRETLERFLTSKGLRKDRDGVAQLSDEEVRAVENGIANANYLKWNSLLIRIHKTIWEIENYSIGHNPEGNSLTQRFEYWKAGWSIFLDHPWLGVGTGDVPDAFEAKYEELDSQLSSQYRLRGHNQYLTIALTFGGLGLLVFVVAMILPFFTSRAARTYPYIIFFTIAAVSMFNEDTLETQMGVTFYAFMTSFLLFVYASVPPRTSR